MFTCTGSCSAEVAKGTRDVTDVTVRVGVGDEVVGAVACWRDVGNADAGIAIRDEVVGAVTSWRDVGNADAGTSRIVHFAL